MHRNYGIVNITQETERGKRKMTKTEQWIQPGDDLQAAIDAAAPGTTLYLAGGVYRVKLCIRTPGLRLVGAGAEKTVLIWDDYALRLDEQGRELNTFRTWTVAVCADGVRMEQLAIVNDALHPEIKGQEVALSVVADDFSMVNCRLTSTQDTLFCGPLPDDLIARYVNFLADELRRGGVMRQRFTDCLIEGTVDFIFGCGESLFERCEIRSLRDARHIGYTAAPAHALNQREGFRFVDCRFTAETGVTPGSIYLARPWRDYGLCRFLNCRYGAHLSPLGFDKWNDTDRDKTARFIEEPPVPGRVPWVQRDKD